MKPCCLVKTTAAASLSSCSMLKGKVQQAWQNDTRHPTGFATAAVTTAGLHCEVSTSAGRKFLSFWEKHKIMINILFGMGVLKSTANSPICMHKGLKQQNSKRASASRTEMLEDVLLGMLVSQNMPLAGQGAGQPQGWKVRETVRSAHSERAGKRNRQVHESHLQVTDFYHITA